MWESHLRDYKQQPEKKGPKVGLKRGSSSYETGSQAPQAGSCEAGDGEKARPLPGKDLDKCAQLLGVMLQTAPELISRRPTESNSSKMFVTRVRKTKMRSAKLTAVAKTTKASDRASAKVAVTRKVAAKAGPRGKGKEHAVDSVSETSTELQLRLVGPKPHTLNNSETLKRLMGAPQLNTDPPIHPGQVVMTKVPNNDHIRSSTPMSSPSANHHRHYSMHSEDHVAASLGKASSQPVPVALGTVYSQPKGYQPIHVQTTPLARNVEALPRSDVQPGMTFNNAQLVDVMKKYVTQNDEYLTSFIQNCLLHGQIPLPPATQESLGESRSARQNCVLGDTVPLPVATQQSHGESRSLGQSGLLGQALIEGHQSLGSQALSKEMVSSLPMCDLQGSGLWALSAATGRGLAQQESEKEEVGNVNKTASGTPVDIDAILRRHNIKLEAPVDLATQKRFDCPPSVGATNFTNNARNFTNNANYPPQSLDSFHLEDPEKLATFECANTGTEENATTEAKPEKKSHRSKGSLGKTTKRVKDKTKTTLAADVNWVGPGKDKPSPADMKTQARTLLYLFGELRAATSRSRDPDVEMLLGEMSQTLEQLTPGLLTFGMSTDLDLALQPLRSENSQLRRRIRILNEQFREKCRAVDEAVKPDPNFQVIHLELQRDTLETQLREESEGKERLQAAITTLAQQIQGLLKERQTMVKVLDAKDTDNVRSQQDWINEASGLRMQLNVAGTARKEAEEKLEQAEQEKLITEVTLQQKTKETDGLRELVKSLQGSMSRLLADLKGSKPQTLTAVDNISRYIENIGSLLKTDRSIESLLDMKPTRDATDKARVLATFPGGADTSPTHRLKPSAFSDSLKEIKRGLIPAAHADELDEVNDGLRRAYQLLNRIDDVITPQGKLSSDNKPKTERQYQRPSSVDKSDLHQRNTASKAGPPEFDPVNDNYQRQLTKELLFEHDLNNGVGGDIIKRMLGHSNTHKQNDRLEPSKSPGLDGISGMATRKAQLPLSKGAEDLMRSPDDPQFSFEKGSPFQDLETDMKFGAASNQLSFNMDTTEYLSPPENLKGHVSKCLGKQIQCPKGETATASSGFTVKEFLAPLADRLYSPIRKLPVGTSVASRNTVLPLDNALISDPVLMDTDDTETDGGEGETDNDEDNETLTLMEDSPARKNIPASMADDSRYSVGDYFMKYTTKKTTNSTPSTQNQTAWTSKTPRHEPVMGYHRSSDVTSPSQHSQSTSFTTVTSAGSPSKPKTTTTTSGTLSENGRGTHSPQTCVYRGTELDTSLSTIKEAETTSLSTGTSLDSATSVDEQGFKDGLAKLDANIARIQSSLHTQIEGYL